MKKAAACILLRGIVFSASGPTCLLASPPASLPPRPAPQTSKPSLHDLMARKSAGPKKLQEVRVNPAIASAFGGAKLAPPPAAPAPAKPAAAPAALAPPPAVHVAPAPASPASPTALAAALSAPAAPLPSAWSPATARSSGASSPWSAASPVAAPGAGFDAFGTGASVGRAMHNICLSEWLRTPQDIVSSLTTPPLLMLAGGSFGAFAEPPLAKPGGSPAGVISLTASAGAGAHASASHALPAYLFAEPTPPAYAHAGAWGSHVAGAATSTAAPVGARHGAAAHKAAAEEEAADAFAEFDPFKQ